MFRVGGVAEDTPADGSIAKADVAKLVDGLGELGVVFDGNAVVDRDADGAVGGLLVDAGNGDDLGCGAFPLVRSEVGGRALQDVEAADDGVGQGQAAGRGDEGFGGGGVFGDESPEDGAEGHSSLEGHEVGSEGSGLDPCGDGELDGGVEGGHRAGPGEAGEDERGDDHGGAADVGEDEHGEGLIDGGDGDDAVGGDEAADAREESGGEERSSAE